MAARFACRLSVVGMKEDRMRINLGFHYTRFTPCISPGESVNA